MFVSVGTHACCYSNDKYAKSNYSVHPYRLNKLSPRHNDNSQLLFVVIVILL
jgi:hypothetical protein